MLGNAHIPSFAWIPRPVTILKCIVYLAVPFALWLMHNYETLTEYFTARAHRDQNKIEVTSLEREFASLLNEKRQLEVGGFATEKAIRERLMMVRPGERVMFIEEPKEGSGEAEAEVGPTRAEPGVSDPPTESDSTGLNRVEPASSDATGAEPQSTPRVDLGAETGAEPKPAPSLEEILKRPIADPDSAVPAGSGAESRPATATIRVTR